MADPVTSQIPRSNLAALIHATAEPSEHYRSTAEMPIAQLDELLVDERKTTPIDIVDPDAILEELEVSPRASAFLQHPRIVIALGLVGGVAIGLACLWT